MILALVKYMKSHFNLDKDKVQLFILSKKCMAMTLIRPYWFEICPYCYQPTKPEASSMM